MYVFVPGRRENLNVYLACADYIFNTPEIQDMLVIILFEPTHFRFV